LEPGAYHDDPTNQTPQLQNSGRSGANLRIHAHGL
jgi:hypothetical protein